MPNMLETIMPIIDDNLDDMDDLLAYNIKANADKNFIIRYASMHGNFNIIDKLLQGNYEKDIDPSIKNNSAIRMASFNRYIRIVNRLLQDSRTRTWEGSNEILREETKKIKLLALLPIPHDLIPSLLDNSPFRLEEIIKISENIQ